MRVICIKIYRKSIVMFLGQMRELPHFRKLRSSVRPKPKLRSKSTEIVRPKLRWSLPNHRNSKNGDFFYRFHVIFENIFMVSSNSIWCQLESKWNHQFVQNSFSIWLLKEYFSYVPIFWQKKLLDFCVFCGQRFGRSFGGSGRSFGFGRISI